MSACRVLTDPPLPATAELLAPSPVYERWWAMTEACSGVTGSLASVTWYQVPGVTHIPLDGSADVQGYWSGASNRIVLVAADTMDGGVVRHEMLHALLRVGGHPRQAFLGSCAGVVDCAEPCVADAGPAPPLPAMLVGPDSIEVSAQLSPPMAGVSNPSRYFTIDVAAHNPAPYPVAVALPLYSLAGSRDGFTFDIRGAAGGVQNNVRAVDPSTWTFMAGETKHQLFDFVVGPFDPVLGQFPAGSYTVRGAYGQHWSAGASFTLPP